ncbi:Carboxylesterase 5A [Halocaridina rubra]|uniref:Carboxylic ester hydrolase n=1 Tax=Halocaridina rubra TaxID=373956 RepID=A0AAN8XHR3_HALRR
MSAPLTYKMQLRLIFIITILDVTFCTQSDSSSEKSFQNEKKELPESQIQHALNLGLEGLVTQADWDRVTMYDDDPPTIDHPNLNGSNETVTVIGKKMMTIKNRTINAFQGIRYAKPPVKEMRFKKPIPEGVYFENNTLIANHLGDKCPQQAMLGPVASGSEDCLNLNVYTPYLPEELPEGDLLPVMFFIHGGAFIIGDAALYLPTKLLDHDIILVVIHYRLGTLGFFSLLNDDAPGNAALWDQIEALKWVQENIEGFGGDKNRVTIFGQSAGSVSVNWLHLLPESKGLFHAVIGDSGSAVDHWALDTEPLASAALVAGKNGCPNDTSVPDEIYECMMNMPHENISLNIWDFEMEERRRGNMGFRGISPIIDLSPDVSQPLIVKSPEEYFTDGDANDVPILVGANKHEGTFVLGIMYLVNLVPNGIVNDTQYLRDEFIPTILKAFGYEDQTNGLGESIIDAFIDGEVTDFNSVSPEFIDFLGVFFLKAGAWRTAKLHAKHLTTNAYFYSFDFESDDTVFTWIFSGAYIPFEAGERCY